MIGKLIFHITTLIIVVIIGAILMNSETKTKYEKFIEERNPGNLDKQGNIIKGANNGI